MTVSSTIERESPPRAAYRRSASPRARQDRWTFLGLSAPSVALLVLIYAYPIGFAFYQSLHNGTLINLGEFIGAGNYVDNLVAPDFWRAALFT
ncbi:MAG: hypothetical protein ACK5KU_02815, partial [Beutenbergiaceae bacterium]